VQNWEELSLEARLEFLQGEAHKRIGILVRRLRRSVFLDRRDVNPNEEETLRRMAKTIVGTYGFAYSAENVEFAAQIYHDVTKKGG